MTSTTKSDPPDPIDELADDAAPPTPGERALIDLQIRPRSQRAQFKRRYAEFADMQKRVLELKASPALASGGDDSDPERGAERMRLWAEMDDYYQKMDDLMRLAAVNPEAYAEWSDVAGDEELAAVFTVFAKRSQPGEASSSAT